MMVDVPYVRKHTNHIKSVGNRIKEFCRIARDTNVPVAIFTRPANRGDWTHDIMNDLEHAYTYKKSRHRWCRLGLSNTPLPKGQASDERVDVHQL